MTSATYVPWRKEQDTRPCGVERPRSIEECIPRPHPVNLASVRHAMSTQRWVSSLIKASLYPTLASVRTFYVASFIDLLRSRCCRTVNTFRTPASPDMPEIWPGAVLHALNSQDRKSEFRLPVPRHSLCGRGSRAYFMDASGAETLVLRVLVFIVVSYGYT